MPSRGRTEAPAPPPRGRPRDPTRRAAILEATLEEFAAVGFEATTMDAIAARSKAAKTTIYRRWDNKTQLILDALSYMEGQETRRERLPDTGCLRGDLLALAGPYDRPIGNRKLRVTIAAAALVASQPQLAPTVEAMTYAPWVNTCRYLIQRAVDRGEVGPVDVDVAAHVVPAMVSSRMLVQHLPPDLRFIESVVDGILLPALGHATAARTGRPPATPQESTEGER